MKRTSYELPKPSGAAQTELENWLVENGLLLTRQLTPAEERDMRIYYRRVRRMQWVYFIRLKLMFMWWEVRRWVSEWISKWA